MGQSFATIRTLPVLILEGGTLVGGEENVKG